MRGRRSSRRRLSRRSQQVRQTPASSAAPRPHRRVLRSSSPRSASTNPAHSVRRPRRVAVPGTRPPRCVILRSMGYSATSLTAETAPSSRRRAVLTRGAIDAAAVPVRVPASCAPYVPEAQGCSCRRPTYCTCAVRVPASGVPCSCRVHPRWRSPSSTPRTGWRAAK